MAKNDVNKNFEKLKEEMMKKKVNASNSQVCESVSEIEYNNEDVFENVNVNKNVNNAEEEVGNTLIESNKIVIKKAKKVQPPKRTTYYLNQETIKKIDKYSKLTGMGKSELVQTLLDVALNNLEVTN